MLFIQNQRKQQGADMSLYEMDHKKAENYRSSQHDFQTIEQNFGEISHIGVEKELLDELNSQQRISMKHDHMNHSQVSPIRQSHGQIRGSQYNPIGGYNNQSLNH